MPQNETSLIIKQARSAVLFRDYAVAIRLYKELLTTHPQNIHYLAALGDVYVRKGDDREALAVFEQIIFAAPDNIKALISIGAIYRRLKEYDKSIAILQKARANGIDDLQIDYTLGFTYKDLGDYNKAIECFEKVITANPNDVLAFNHLGVIYALDKDYTKAINTYKRGLQIDPNHPILHLNLAHAYADIQDYDKATASYQTAICMRPGWAEPITDYVQLLMSNKQTHEAAVLMKKSIAINPDEPLYKKTLGDIFLEQYNYEEALKLYEEIRDTIDENPDALSRLAHAYEQLDRRNEAIQTITRAETVAPGNREIEKQHASILLSTDRLEEALSKIKKLYAASKTDVQVLDLFGQYYICKRDEKSSDWCFRKINSIDPEYDTYLKNAAHRYKQLGLLKKAETMAKRYLTRHATDTEAHALLGQIQESQSDYVGALDAFQRALSYDAENALARTSVHRLNAVLNDPSVALPPVQEDTADTTTDETDMSDADDTPPPELIDETELLPDTQDAADVPGVYEDPLALDAVLEDELIEPEPDDIPIDRADAADESEAEYDDMRDTFDHLMPESEPFDGLSGNDTVSSEPVFSEEDISMPETADSLPHAWTVSDSDDSMPEPEQKVQPAARTRPAHVSASAPDIVQPAAEPVGLPQQENQQPFSTVMPSLEQQAAQFLTDTAQSAQNIQRAATRAARAAAEAEKTAQQMKERMRMEPTTDNAFFEEPMPPIPENERPEKIPFNLPETAPSGGTPRHNVDSATPSYEEVELELETDETAHDDEISQHAEESFQNALALLPDVVTMLKNKEDVAHFSHLLSLFVKFRQLAEFLPAKEREEFLHSQTRMQLDYIIARLSGKPGLLTTVDALRTLAEIRLYTFSGSDSDIRTDAKKVLTNLANLTESLTDKDLRKALSDSASAVLREL